ncbi:MAG: hypothetical protein PHV78_01660 [Patescibacteria group bacterium]|nr:hypothetical protein [Patescibacteria group bacterium]MDD5121142.1 hypothetical protein [Patescibacteria group bacterium]MDD5221657.1 hypothetical protein [Patescibacteria group bacterium]MDD5395939.1 hypothetical protein [Patescibacteria group bacterium]
MAGYKFNGSSCVYQSPSYSVKSYDCPLNSHISTVDPTKCQCDSGYQVNSIKTACVIIATQNLTTPISGTGDSGIGTNSASQACSWGYKKNRVNGQCDKVVVPSNAHFVYSGDDWVCDNGYKQIGNYCQLIQVGQTTPTSDNQECNWGYKRSGVAPCEVIILPSHAHYTYDGHDWVCDNGYKQIKDACYSTK